jgi:hypothetical protein
MNERIDVPASRFEKQHLDLWVFGETIGEHAACRAGADDDIVVHLFLFLFPPSPLW